MGQESVTNSLSPTEGREVGKAGEALPTMGIDRKRYFRGEPIRRTGLWSCHGSCFMQPGIAASLYIQMNF